MMLADEEIGRMGKDELREEVRRLTAETSKRTAQWSKSEDEKMRAMQMTHSARIRIQSVQAIRHLKRHMPEALGINMEPNIDIALIDAIKDLDRADEIADTLPF